MLDVAVLIDQVRSVLSGARAMPLTAGEIFERLPCRDALLVECARRTDAFEAHERALAWISELLVKHLCDEVRFEVVEGNGVAVELGHTLLTAPGGPVVVYRLRQAPRAPQPTV